MGDEWVAPVLRAWEKGSKLRAVGDARWESHLEHARRLVEVIGGPPERVLDLGTGSGLPGLALAGLWPTAEVVLLDASARRLDPVLEAIAVLGWRDRVSIAHGRAETLGREDGLREAFDLVVARSFGQPAVVAECGSPFVRVGGRLAVSEPEGSDGTRWHAVADHRLGLMVGAHSAEPVHLQLLDKVSPVAEHYPRRDGVPAKRPLF